MKPFLRSVSLQHGPKASDVITLVKKTFVARVSYEILYHEVISRGFTHASRADIRILHTEWWKNIFAVWRDAVAARRQVLKKIYAYIVSNFNFDFRFRIVISIFRVEPIALRLKYVLPKNNMKLTIGSN